MNIGRSLPKPQFPHLLQGHKKSNHSIGLLRELSEITHVEQCMALSACSVCWAPSPSSLQYLHQSRGSYQDPGHCWFQASGPACHLWFKVESQRIDLELLADMGATGVVPRETARITKWRLNWRPGVHFSFHYKLPMQVSQGEKSGQDVFSPLVLGPSGS